MFNNKIKEEFLSSTEKKEEYIKLFNLTSSREVIENKELFDFDIEDIQELSLEDNQIQLLSEYIDWSILRGYRNYYINTAEFLLLHVGDEE